ncbi:unnamed protein product [Pieris macdunnoughi]|uniref:Endonuclease/exonuclease/phosphatase domain-containing protein n=1 Tax=Pieris macdunnoughi TaxID=345717 RepID=A0A821XDA1_9NEOP|nr:unnamed protein product [Pieris macdunnoughi]
MANLVIQRNCNSIRSKKSELTFLINKFAPSILAISETWLLPGSRFRVSGYRCLRDDRDDGYAGCAFLVSRSLTFHSLSLPHCDGINAVAMRAFNISFISVYIPHPHIDLISDIRSIILSVPPPVVMLGDFNAHHVSWGCHSSDSFGSLLLDLLDDINISVLNNGCPTRRSLPSQNPANAVDLSLCSPDLFPFLSWRVFKSTCGSDHFPILIDLPTNLRSVTRPSPLLKFKLNQANWSDFSSSIDSKIAALPAVSVENCLSSYNDFVNSLTSSASLHIPLKSSTQRKISPPWWDSECTEMIRKRKTAERSYSLCMTLENFLVYQQASAAARRLLNNKKRLGWHKFCESMCPGTPSSVVWRQIRRFRCYLNSYDVPFNDPSSWITSFADKLAPPSVPFYDCLPYKYNSYIPSSNSLDCQFSLEELNKALNGISDSSPGEDGIPYSFLINSSLGTKRYFLDLVNCFFDLGIIPESWNRQIVIPLLKPGKDPSDFSSYRPIALSSTLLKIMEHLIKIRLEWFC